MTLKLSDRHRIFNPVRLGDIEDVNLYLTRTRVPKEFSRRMRGVDDSLKAEECRNFGLFFAPIVIQAMKTPKAARTWAFLMYIMRMYYCSDVELAATDQPDRIAIVNQFMTLYTSTFGPGNCTYTFHMCAHLETLRERCPLPEESATAFEGGFAYVRSGFQPGTFNTPKQIFQNVYTRNGMCHRCKRKITVCPKTTSKRDDSLLYKFNSNDQTYSFFKVFEIRNKGRHLLVKKIHTMNVDIGTKENLLKWSRVGVFQFHSLLQGNGEIIHPINFFTGKAIQIPLKGKSLIMSVPNEVLTEN